MSVLIACIGNIFQGDDAFGCEVARILCSRPLPPGVKVVDFGIRSLDLIYALLDAPELTVLVDAVYRGGEPGTLYTIEPDIDEPGAGQALDAHTMDVVQVLRTAKSMGGNLSRIRLVGCEPADLGGMQGRMGLTPAIAATLQEAADMVISCVQKQLEEVGQ